MQYLDTLLDVGDERDNAGYALQPSLHCQANHDACVMQYLNTLQDVGNERDGKGHIGITTEITLPSQPGCLRYAVS